MSLSIAQKLICAFLGLTLLLITATLGLARWSFERGFLDYVNALEQTRLERLAGVLVNDYTSSDSSWESLDRERFAVLMRRATGSQTLRGPLPRRRPPPDARGEVRRSEGPARPPPRNAAGATHRPPGAERPPPRAAAPPTALYDHKGKLLAGADIAADDSLAIRVPIIVNGTTVGELRSEPRREISSPLETDFSRQQLRTSWILGVVSLILAFAVSLLLARGLLAPVRRMISSVGRLSSGDYSHRMKESRSDELGQLTRDLDRLGSTLEANQTSRKRLLADISHELRTPLTVLTGEIEALKDGVREFDRAQLESLDQEVKRLCYLVNDLYELSVSDMGGLSYQFLSLDLTECVQNALDGMRKRAAAAGIELRLGSGVEQAKSGPQTLRIEADARRMDQLLQNLLENSLAYTDSPGRVSVALSRTSDRALIAIDDSPPGVSTGDCEQLFEPLFRQDTSRSRRTGGSGLGLAICRNIVAAHGGTISAEPSALGGLSIRVEIPLARESSL
ncbi:MAG: two-component system sensor histidine kinase BaeS [Halieaceae bacterium]|jgi:two-component system sensor histidine kinase BaeS